MKPEFACKVGDDLDLRCLAEWGEPSTCQAAASQHPPSWHGRTAQPKAGLMLRNPSQVAGCHNTGAYINHRASHR